MDAIAGFERVHYLVSARAGQMLSVDLAIYQDCKIG
jgi:hypothetical protein